MDFWVRLAYIILTSGDLLKLRISDEEGYEIIKTMAACHWQDSNLIPRLLEIVKFESFFLQTCSALKMKPTQKF